MKSKCLVVIIFLLFVVTSNNSLIAKNIEKISQPSSRGDWLYVGGSGPGNYTKIQDAIDNASGGNAIYVYSGIYIENIRIEKTLTLQGQNKETTIINGGRNTSTITIFNDNVQIIEFTITNCSLNDGAGVDIYANGCRITNTIIVDCDCCIKLQNACGNIIQNNTIIRQTNTWLKHGIELEQSHNNRIIKNNITNTGYSMQLKVSNGNTISNNIFTRNQFGIWLDQSHNTNISENTLTLSDNFGFWIKESNNNILKKNYVLDNKGTGIWILSSQGNLIQENQINNNRYSGIEIESSKFNLINQNEVTNNENGIYLESAYLNLITKNNIFDNDKDALFRNAWVNHWWKNYWKTPTLGPKIIQGTIFKVVRHGYGFEQVDILTLFKCDWYPAKKSYDIIGMS